MEVRKAGHSVNTPPQRWQRHRTSFVATTWTTPSTITCSFRRRSSWRPKGPAPAHRGQGTPQGVLFATDRSCRAMANSTSESAADATIRHSFLERNGPTAYNTAGLFLFFYARSGSTTDRSPHAHRGEVLDNMRCGEGPGRIGGGVLGKLKARILLTLRVS